VVMLPAPPGNRMGASLDTTKLCALGWEPKHTLPAHIAKTLQTITQTIIV
jgi:hypothetical protein